MADGNNGVNTIRAAGGLIWRDSVRGREVAVIHRARYGDWTLPKGKLKPGEDWREAAIREVKEETGCTVQLQSFAGVVSYEVKGVPKVVQFWNMVPIGESKFEPSEEVDKVTWLSLQKALEVLDYDGERDLLRKIALGS
jgi:8-oxo-dGTP diphosphatase